MLKATGRVGHVLFIIDLVRNVEQCFHMADLQESRRGRGGGASQCVTVNWWCTALSAETVVE